MKTSTVLGVIVALIVIGGGWYWYSGMQSAQTAPTQDQAQATPQGPDAAGLIQPNGIAGVNGSANQTNTGQATVPPVVSASSDAALGTILVATNGMTLYTYTNDASGVSNCSGACATSWRPYTSTANELLVPGSGVTGALATITRADGTTQLTYNGMPLYFFSKDVNAGDTLGNNVGGLWNVVKP